MQDILVGVCVVLALIYVWRNVAGKLGNKQRCCGCQGCSDRETCADRGKKN